MIQTLAKKLLPLVNTKKNTDALSDYMEYRIEEHYRIMEQAQDTQVLHHSQGAIRELRRLKTLRDEVVMIAESK